MIWSHNGPVATSATCSNEKSDVIATVINVPAAPAATATADSPRGLYRVKPPAGQIITGKLISLPNTVVASLRSLTSIITRGRRTNWRNAASLLALVVESNWAAFHALLATLCLAAVLNSAIDCI